ncbi:Nucleoside-diphosphate-sugar epimerase [Sanguibacter gelidistatuariae]|uniref:Nucleoside-diphosphate-sugar epimerase n=1 Tax=Sanguibacter gelidistatuariae TaxID=1814289 RepID=A0A1G6KSP1_9MICO|nr:NAD-dependent epimerase/dehydratase family protein [Sanguibacter gelidistatuariae]SDC34119.1 Nucleoside-diphosphate-sugar epimerase [Sanguibacter gelidistatuariae]
MTVHVIIGKGPIGSTTAELLLARGEEVRMVSRSGAPDATSRRSLHDVEHVAADASDAASLTRATVGADVVYNCVNPAYHRWATDWPPISNALLSAAQAHDAVLVTAANLYVYGPTFGPMTEQSPLASKDTKGQVRAQMWLEAKRRHDAGQVRITEVRASDYIGPRALISSHVGERLLEPLLAGKTIRPIGSADQPHTWTYLPDLARALLAAGETEAAWGQAWHGPSPQARTFREVACGFAREAGMAEPRISPVPLWAVAALGTVQPMLREVARIGYQFTEPFVMESATAEQVLAVTPSSWDTITTDTLAWWNARAM